MYKKEKGFTLMEIIAVLVIISIIGLIAVPIISSIKAKAKLNSYKRSIDAYGRAVELAMSDYLLNKGSLPSDLKTLKIEYTGNKVECNIMQIKENGSVYLSECIVNGKEIKDKKTEDGWYHYNERDLTNEEYVDMYGDALKKASASYYEKNGHPVDDYNTLALDYKGKKVECDVKINYNGTIYMTNCKVNRTDVNDELTEDGYYHYGVDKYQPYDIGDIVSYNNIDFYVIENSDDNQKNLTMLKAEPLTAEEINQYGGVGTENNYVNKYAHYLTGTALDRNGYGYIAYYSSETCGYINNNEIKTGCIANYEQSDIKYVVDAWAVANIPNLEEARLISWSDLEDNLGFIYHKGGGGEFLDPSNDTPSWAYNSNYWYWTMKSHNSSDSHVYRVEYNGGVNAWIVYEPSVVRPVITIKKDALTN